MRVRPHIAFPVAVSLLLVDCGSGSTTEPFGLGSDGGGVSSGSMPMSGSSAASSGNASASSSSSSMVRAGSSTSSGSPTVQTGSSGSSTSSGTSSSPSSSFGMQGSSSASSSSSSGSSSDSGLQPFKGVANSPCADLVKLGAAWYYNWTTSPSPPCPTPPQFVPMIWGHAGTEQTSTGIANEILGIVNAGYGTVLGFNEPDNGSQSNISVATAISLWPSMGGSAAVRVGSPATQGNTTGLTWIRSFMTQVNADTTGMLRVDFIATHWYGWNAGSCDAKASNLESWIVQIEAIPGDRPIWLTEWGCLNASNPDAASVQAFYSGALVMFAKHPRIERYAWYPWNTYNELAVGGDGGSTLTSLGSVFAAAPASK